MLNRIKVIGFDADDTLWINENFFRQAEAEFAGLMKEYASEGEVIKTLYDVEYRNIPLYGYGIKAFMLSVMETALLLSSQNPNPSLIAKIIEIGKQMLVLPVELLPGAQEILEALAPHHRLVLATKGDLHDQQRKLKESGLEQYFHHVEIMSEKTTLEYGKLLRHIDLDASHFMMIGNSLKSDVLPVLKLGGKAVHIPYHITWAHEVVDEPIEHPDFYTIESLLELKTVFMDTLQPNG
ncbi:MAG: HAD family hydrolase [Breznakibacter sp.]|nr:HAD family hydrolase [Breznakibacter sp.]